MTTHDSGVEALPPGVEPSPEGFGKLDVTDIKRGPVRPAGVPEPVELDAAGQPKLPLTLLEQKAIATLNTIKAWRDSDGNEPFPDDAREGMELVLMLAAARRKGVR